MNDIYISQIRPFIDKKIIEPIFSIRLFLSHKIIPLTFSWKQLRKICNMQVVSYTVFMPLVGYLIIGNTHIIDLLRASTDFFGKENFLTIKPIMKLQLVYIGFFFIGLGEAIYKFYCPEIVKLYDEIDYKKESLNLKETYSLLQIRDSLLMIKTITNNEKKILQRFDQGTTENKTHDEFYKAYYPSIAFIYEKHYEVKSESLIRPRFFSSLFLVIGFIFLATISLISMVNVFFAIFQ